jgi:hypothetical protein
LFDVMGSAYHIFEGITFRNTEVALWAGVKDVAGAVGLAVKNCRFESVGIGIDTQFAGSTGFYIADNVFIGRDDHYRTLGWASPGIYGASDQQLLWDQGVRIGPHDRAQRGGVLP